MPSILNTATSGLRAYQGALATTSQNIANVGNEAYTRQRVEFNARLPQNVGQTFVGQGMDLTDVQRLADEFIIGNIRDFSSSTSRLGLFESYASRIENMIADDQASLLPAMNGFFNALNDVSNDPSASAPRVALLGSAEIMQQRFNDMAGNLQGIGQEVDNQISFQVSEINGLTTEIARLNESIARISLSTQQPADLLDQRDKLLNQLAEKISVNVVEQTDGTLNVLVGSGQLLVSGSLSINLATQNDPAQPGQQAIALQGAAGNVDITSTITGGELGGLLDVRNSILSEVQNRLGRTAIALSESVNAVHTQGYSLNGVLGTDFFSTVGTGRLEGSLGGDYVNNGFDVGDTVSFDLLFDGQTVTASYTVLAGDTNTQVADGLLASINADANVTDNGDGTYTLAGTSAGASLTFQLSGTDIAFVGDAGVAGTSNSLQINNVTDDDASGAGVNALLDLNGVAGATVTNSTITVGGSETFTGGVELAIANANNTGTAEVSYAIADVSALTLSDYQVRFDGTNYNVLRLSDNQTVASGAGPSFSNVDGLNITISGAANNTDSFLIQPTREGALRFTTLITDQADIAAASPIRASSAFVNIGDVSVSGDSVTNVGDANLLNPVTITFNNPPGTFDVFDTVQGVALATNVAYTPGMNVAFNGWQVQLDGSPAAGDVITVEENTSASSDNRNMLSLIALQSTGILDGNNTTFQRDYSALTTAVGSTTQQVKINLQVEQSLLTSTQAERESISGVNLDEEAADLIRFQQAYQAMSRVVQTAQTLFQTLLDVV